MLSNRHFGKPEPKGERRQSLQVAAVAIANREVLLVLMDWEAVKGQTEMSNSFNLLKTLFPGKNVVIVARDPLKYGQPAVFLGPPDFARLFEGRQIGDFRWSAVEFKTG